MTDDYAEYEKQCKRIRKRNAKLLAAFGEWLAAKGLSAATVAKHCDNMAFYLDEFLLYEDVLEAEDGVGKAGKFLGYWFIEKAMWASRASMKSNAVSIQKFYTFMLEMGRVEQEDVDRLKARIKADMPEWLATLARYDDPDITDPDEIWGS
jgi:hypothetical protein